jgi:UDP:flavonoid glycosyltransferase YjiC (YdhE family)
MSKTEVLFITAAIRSHIIPSLYIANLLSDNCNITYAVENDILEQLVESQGFNAVRYDNHQENLETNTNRTFLGFVRDELTAKNFKNRKILLQKLIEDLTPSVIVIDIFRSYDFYYLHHYQSKIKIFFFNPMVSTYRVEGFLTVAGKSWIKEEETKINAFKQPKHYFFSKLKAYNEKKILKTCKKGFKELISSKSTFATLFENQLEFVLAPLEFEYSPEVKRDNQIYWGYCTSKKRVDTELDDNFDLKFAQIVEKRQEGKKIIYCSFGTFYAGSNVPVINFFRNLLDAVAEIPNIQVVCSVNDIVIQTLEYQRTIPANIHLFSRTPQLKVLENTDIFITHGGFGSIKESIDYCVPMIVYPLDLNYDQYGNSLKVAHHKIGIAGTFKSEQPNNLKENIITMLSDDSYKDNITKMNEAISQNYAFYKQKEVIQQLIAN